MTTSNTTEFDVIVVGSGMGGLTTASLLAQIGKKRVLLLEKHFKPGGFTHSFRRKKYEWDVGVHYVGQMQDGSMTRRIMDLVTRKGVQWHPMGSPYERIIFPEGSFDFPVGEEAFRDALVERFPEEKKSITQYFRDVRRMQSWIGRWFVSKQYHPAIASAMTAIGRSMAETVTDDYFDRFNSPLLAAILGGQWPDFGTPPSRSAFALHSAVTTDFFDGGFYPIGGSKEIANHAIAAIEAAGGACLVNHPVQQILIKNGKAYGVLAEHKGKEVRFTAPCIVSNAGARTTFMKLVSDDHAVMEKEKASRLVPGPSADILFLGLKRDPREVGFQDVNHWIYSRLDHDDLARYEDGVPQRIDGAFLSFGSLRNPGQEPHTAQIITFSRASDWNFAESTQWMRRGEEYEQAKQRRANDLLEYVDTRVPGLRDIVDYAELSSPLTVESFTGHWQGTVYGQECSPSRLNALAWPIGTSVRGLYQTGSDVGTPGVNGAMMAGVMTASKLLGPLGLAKVMTKAFVQ